MELLREIDGYCERLDATYWAEPGNAVTNAAFVLAAIWMWRRSGGVPLARALAAILFAIGVGSYLFHTHAQVWAAIADVVPIALFDRACWWRDAAIAALEKSGRPYRIVFSSQSVAGVTAAVEAGIAIGLLGKSSIGPQLRTLGTQDGFGETPASQLVIGTSAEADRDLVVTMSSAIRTAFQN